jgi:hypothetical protein
MRIPVAVIRFALLFASLLVAAVAWAGNPIPGVGVVVKQCKCPPDWKCCSAASLRVGPGFFGPGSAPVDSGVSLQGQCSFDCNDCDDDCDGGPPDTEFDFAADSPAGPFEVTVPATTLYSMDPIAVDIGGVTSYFDVFVTVSGPGPLADDAIPGTLAIPGGASLDVGTTSTVASSSLDVHVTITFADHNTGVLVVGTIEQDLHLTLQDPALPIARIADGTPDGHIVPGGNGVTVTPFTYASSGDELRLQVRALEPGAPVPARPSTWGAIKSLYR